ncbi:hypothetical protein ZWY2020_045562 [Hordeum vulgare]|nr:hypothetical protein ZWY2020_045562 [Hordeum vulgare]
MASAAALPERKKKSNFMYAFTCAVSASMATVVLGYGTEIMMVTLSVYALIGSFAGARTSDWIGRRYTVAIAAAIFFAGSLLMSFAVDYAMLMFGRFGCGMAASAAATQRQGESSGDQLA